MIFCGWCQSFVFCSDVVSWKERNHPYETICATHLQIFFYGQVEEKIGDVTIQIFYIQLSKRLNFKYIGLERASLPHRTHLTVNSPHTDTWVAGLRRLGWGWCNEWGGRGVWAQGMNLSLETVLWWIQAVFLSTPSPEKCWLLNFACSALCSSSQGQYMPYCYHI